MSTVPDTTTYNLVRFKAAHNSEERDEVPIHKQLATDSSTYQQHCSGLELDIHSNWEVYDNPFDTSKKKLVSYLQDLSTWSAANPGHRVITVFLDIKGSWKSLDSVDTYLKQHFTGKIYTPGDLARDSKTLQKAVQTTGWPTLASLKGKFIFCFTAESNSLKASYASKADGTVDTSRLCFCAARDLGSYANYVFYNLHVCRGTALASEEYSLSDVALLGKLADRHFVSRIWILNSGGIWSDALRTSANILVTDKVSNHSWATVGGDGVFTLAEKAPA